MPKTITVDPLSRSSIQDAIKELKKYKKWIAEKERELRMRLAMRGATVASIQFARAIYNGTNDVSVRVDDTGSVAVIYAEGSAVAFIEFGAGAAYGYGHPMNSEFGIRCHIDLRADNVKFLGMNAQQPVASQPSAPAAPAIEPTYSAPDNNGFTTIETNELPF